jgi:hypothetical protein
MTNQNALMQATELDREYLRRLDKKYPDILEHIAYNDPRIKEDGAPWRCLCVSKPNSSIPGCGQTPQDALEDCEKNYLKAESNAKI